MTARTITRSKTARNTSKAQHESQNSKRRSKKRSKSGLPRQAQKQQSLEYALQNSFLIIGYGNELRGDGAVGAQVASRVSSWNVPQVRTMTVHQLTPDLATEIASVDYAIFVEACSHRSCALNVQVNPLTIISDSIQKSPGADIAFTHAHGAKGLLILTYNLYGYVPQAWMMQVPAESFDLGDALSSTAQHGVDEAIKTIERFLTNYQVPCSSPSC